MPKDATINARVDKHLKAKAEKVLNEVGISTSEVITMMLHQIVLRQGLPFEARIPNAATRKAMAELDNPKTRAKLPRYDTAEEMFDDILGTKRASSKRKA
jgi:DNA-damage-inducible protein J